MYHWEPITASYCYYNALGMLERQEIDTVIERIRDRSWQGFFEYKIVYRLVRPTTIRYLKLVGFKVRKKLHAYVISWK